jgi:hypothetical protein
VPTSYRVILPYRYFAVCDWITESGIADTNALLALARRHVVASDGRQIIICPTSDTAVTVHFEHLGDAPAGDDDVWDGTVDLPVESPSGRIYIDQPTAQVIDLKDALAAGAGTYAARIAWRGREAGDGHEEYLIQMWRTGPVSDATLADLESDED